MQLCWISFALLLYANLTRVVKGTLEVSVATGLAAAPVDNIEGVRCSDYDPNFADVSKELRESKACKPGEEGFDKHKYLKVVTYVEDYDQEESNKSYLCCIDSREVCIYGKIETVPEKDANGKEWPTAVDCSGSKSCQNPKTHFCLQEAANNPNHYQRIPDAVLMDAWKNLPRCCQKFVTNYSCDYEKSYYIGEEPNEGDCEKNFGRCKADDRTSLCSKKKHDKWLSSCCKPLDSELCPGGIYPFGLKDKHGRVDWIADNSGDVDAWKKACLDLATKPEFVGAKIYISDGKCCAKAKLHEARYYGKDYADLFTDQYDRFSMKGCKNDADCGEDKFCGTVSSSSYNNEPATGKACFEKILCPPHDKKTVYPVLSTENTLICTDSSTCPTGSICVTDKPATATAAKIKKNFGMCCPKVAPSPVKQPEELLSASPSNHFFLLLIFLPLVE